MDNPNLRIIIEAILAFILGLYTLIFLQLSQELFYFLLVALGLGHLALFYFIFGEHFKKALFCGHCSGNGKLNCTYCYGSGRLKPNTNHLIATDYTLELIELSPKNYSMRINDLKIGNAFYTGKIATNIKIEDAIFKKIRGTTRVETTLTNVISGNMNKASEESIAIDLGDVSDILNKIGGNNPRKEHFRPEFTFENLDSGIECGSCSGKGKKSCNVCKGKRLKFLIKK